MFKKAKQTSLVMNVVSQIEKAILDQTYRPEQKLPSPQELMDLLKTSRGTLREALRILEQKGLIEIRLGVKGGAFVKEANAKSVSEGLDLLIRHCKISLEDLTEFRIVIEPSMISLVIERATEDDLKSLNKYIEQMRIHTQKGANSWEDFLDVSIHLRKTLIRLARNYMYEAILIPLFENIMAYVHHYLPGENGLVEEAFRDWENIIKAIQERDNEKASSLTVEHTLRYAKLMIASRDRYRENDKKLVF